MSRISAILVVVLFTSVVGCTTAGPFVTSISNAGDGRIVVEKCMAKLNMWTGTLSNDDCTNSTIRVEQAQQRRQVQRRR